MKICLHLCKNLLVFVSFLLLTACMITPVVHQPMFTQTPNRMMLDPSIANSTIIANAPPTKINVMRYQAYTTPDTKFYSNYQITHDVTTNNFTQYHTVENTIDHGNVIGHGLGYGGMFSIIYFKQGDIPNSPEFYKRYRWTSISDVKGQLFPLKVGNRLEFRYHEQVKYSPGTNDLSDQENNGLMRYEVIGHQIGYRNGNTYVPGDIYIIRWSKTTNNGVMLPQNEYYFSQNLGWYIQAKYYFNDKPMVVYKLVGFS